MSLAYIFIFWKSSGAKVRCGTTIYSFNIKLVVRCSFVEQKVQQSTEFFFSYWSTYKKVSSTYKKVYMSEIIGN